MVAPRKNQLHFYCIFAKIFRMCPSVISNACLQPCLACRFLRVPWIFLHMARNYLCQLAAALFHFRIRCGWTQAHLRPTQLHSKEVNMRGTLFGAPSNPTLKCNSCLTTLCVLLLLNQSALFCTFSSRKFPCLCGQAKPVCPLISPCPWALHHTYPEVNQTDMNFEFSLHVLPSHVSQLGRTRACSEGCHLLSNCNTCIPTKFPI